MAIRKDKDEAPTAEPRIVIEPVLPEGDEKVNSAQGELQETVDAAEDKGFLGDKTDPTPDHHYSVAGVTAGLPTPETERSKA